MDAGCGLGLLSQWAAKAGGSVLAVDLDDVNLATLLAAENELAEQIEFRRANLFDLIVEEPALAQSFDVLIAMVYLNDPRRDETQTELSLALKESFLKPGGRMIPERVEYYAVVCDWPSQDWPTRQTRIGRDVRDISQRYGIQFQALQKHLQSTAYKEFFPQRDANGQIARGDCRLLGEMQPVFCVDYTRDDIRYPENIELRIGQSGTANSVMWVQQLFVGTDLIFANESVSWIANPQSVTAGDQLVLPLNSRWRQQNILQIQQP